LEKEKEKPKRSLRRKIFNGVIGFFVSLVVLFVLLVGFSQTFTFREILRKKIISVFNENTGGVLNIGKIEGTLLTTLTISDLSIKIDNDTAIAAKKIKLFISPLQIFLNKVYVRDFQADDLKLVLLQDSAGVWNISKLAKDTTTSKSDSFVEAFQINNLNITNLHFVAKKYQFKNINTKYDIINFADLDIRRINISGSALGSIKDNDYTFKLNNFSLSPNLQKFTIKKFSGEFFLNTKFVSVRNFRIETDSTDINFTARLDSINLFKKITLEDFKNYPAQLQLDVKSFWFDDLSSFLGDTEILKGRPSLKLVADGKFGAINIRQLKMKYLNTSFEAKGTLTKLNTPEQMYIDASIQKGYADYDDVLKLLPNLKLPVFKDLRLKDIDIKFKGEPTKFNAKLNGQIDEGKFTAEAFLNVQPKLIEYNAKIETDKLNFKSITGFDTEINSVSTIKGKGVKPEELESQFLSQISNSKMQNNVIHDFKISANGSAGNIVIDFNTAINNLRGTISGTMDFTNPELPRYNFAGKFNSLNLYQFTADSTLDSKLNFGVFAQGEKFDPDNMMTDITINLDASTFNSREVPQSQLRLFIDTRNETKKIDLFSPFADFNFSGKFSLKKAVQLIKYEAETINSVITQKLDELNPLSVVQENEIVVAEERTIPDIVKYDLNIDYSFFFKDLQPFSQLLKANRLDIYGKGSGAIQNDSSNFSITAKIQVDNFVKINDKASNGGKSSSIYFSEIEAGVKFSRNNNTLSFDNLFGTASLSAEKFYIDNDIRKLNADLTFNQSRLFFNTSAVIDSIWTAELEGKASFSAQAQEITIDRALLSSQGIEWTNVNPFFLSFASDNFQLNNFLMKNKNSTISASAQIFNVGYINGEVKVSGLSIKETEQMFPKFKGEFTGMIDLNGKIEGKLSDPVITSSINIKNLGIKNKITGNLFCNLNYSGKNITTDLKILDSLNTINNPVLTLAGNIPYNLNLSGGSKTEVLDNEINLLLKSTRFDMSTLGDLLPLVINQEGLLESDLQITGTLDSPEYEGFLRVKEGKVTGRLNNLTYNCGLKVNFKGTDIRLDSMVVRNTPDSKYIGTLTGTGKIELDGLDIKKIKVFMNGDLAVYGENSKFVTPQFYGDLFVASDGNWQYDFDNGKSFFQGKVLLKQTNLTYTTGQDLASSAGSGDINFIYLADPKKSDLREIEFRKILDAQNQGIKEGKKIISTFGYNISVQTLNDANIVFVFANLANKKLTVYAQTRNLVFKSDSGPLGKLELQSGSNMDLIKTFKATGSVFFENDIANPNLDVTAIYENEHVPVNSTDSKSIYQVEMKLNGTLDQLAANLGKEKGKFKIYELQGMQGGRVEKGRKSETDIDNDAISFILTGKLKDELSQGEKTSLASTLSNSVATSLVGSFLTNYLNSVLGNFVTDVKLSSDIFSIGGEIKGLSYEFGGSTQNALGLGTLKLRLEYPLLSNVRARYERKDPILKTTQFEKKIDEIGLKLRFVF